MPAFAFFLIRLDWSVFHAINSLAGRSSVLDWLARLGADDHILPVVLVLLVLSTIVLARNRKEKERAFLCVMCAILAAVISMVLLFGLNAVFFRPRPFMSHAVHLLFYHNTDSAFPSNAATLAFSLTFAVFMYNRRVGAIMLAVACYTGLARIMVGVHYPLDIIAGLLLGLASASFARLAEPLYRPLAPRLTDLEYRLLRWSAPPERPAEYDGAEPGSVSGESARAGGG